MGEGKSVGQRDEWGERRRLKQGDGEQRPKSMSYEEDDRDACAQNGAQAKFCSKGVQTIGYTPGNRSAYQSQCGSPAKHDPEFLGPEPGKKGETHPNALKSAQYSSTNRSSTGRSAVMDLRFSRGVCRAGSRVGPVKQVVTLQSLGRARFRAASGNGGRNFPPSAVR